MPTGRAPNTAAAGCLLSGRIADGPHPARLAAALAARHAPSAAFPVNYGHTALAIALDLFRARAPGRSEVLVLRPTFARAWCRRSPRPGLRAVAVAVGPDLNLTPAGGGGGARPGHAGGRRAPHVRLPGADRRHRGTVLKQAGVFLVDDAAQVVGETSEGRLLGTFGDVGLISFAQSKAVVTGVRGSGGVLLVNRPEFEADARRACEALPLPRGRLRAFAYFVWNYLWAARTGKTGYYLARA
ncbi:DegT/DnrJ/EryC1/StrS family aminotransferase [Massilia sp. H-1]|nr:DegT/DnrJ/EryC1/StrS family aminotransferase [Massilia sp. H-1]